MTIDTPRYNIYGFIHKALRAHLTETLLLLGRMDCEDDENVCGGLNSLREILDLCCSHLEHENRFLHTAMERYRQGSSAQIAEEHLEHERAIDQLFSGAAEVQSLAGSDREQAAGRLYRQFAVFVAENLEHMHKEETLNNRVLWSAFTDEELRGIERTIVESQSPQEKARVMRLMIPAMNPSERAQLLGGMRRGMPAEPFREILTSVRQLLNPGDWFKLEKALA